MCLTLDAILAKVNILCELREFGLTLFMPSLGDGSLEKSRHRGGIIAMERSAGRHTTASIMGLISEKRSKATMIEGEGIISSFKKLRGVI